LPLTHITGLSLFNQSTQTTSSCSKLKARIQNKQRHEYMYILVAQNSTHTNHFRLHLQIYWWKLFALVDWEYMVIYVILQRS